MRLSIGLTLAGVGFFLLGQPVLAVASFIAAAITSPPVMPYSHPFYHSYVHPTIMFPLRFAFRSHPPHQHIGIINSHAYMHKPFSSSWKPRTSFLPSFSSVSKGFHSAASSAASMIPRGVSHVSSGVSSVASHGIGLSSGDRPRSR